MRRPAKLLVVAAGALALAGCATTPTRGLNMDPLLVTVDAEDLALSRLNDEELFACGTTAYQAKDYRRATKCFTRVADNFPRSRHAKNAQYNAGVAHESLGEYLLAIERYRTVMDPEKGTGDALDATWRAASSFYHLGDYPGAIGILERVAARTDLAAVDHIHALAHIGVCYVEMGDIASAEGRLREALASWRERSDIERIDDYYPCQAQFFLAEIYRLHFEAVKLASVDDTQKLGDDLEYKAQLLLSAQGHYLRAIRMGNSHWAIAAGQRIGGLYEGLYDEMTKAPIPSSLESDQVETYRSMLRTKVRVLVTKAIAIYERTLSTAERVGVSSVFLEQTRNSLDRMKQVLLADAATDEKEAEGGPAAPAESDPDQPPSARVPGREPAAKPAAAPGPSEPAAKPDAPPPASGPPPRAAARPPAAAAS